MQKRFPTAKPTERGETIAEYVLMLALIFVIVAFAALTVGDHASSAFNAASDRLINLVR